MLDSRLIHALLNSPSLMIESEDALFQTMTEVGGGISEFGGYIDLRFLSDAGMVNFVGMLNVGLLTPALWSNIEKYLKKVADEERRWTRFRLPFDSKIIPTVPSVLEEFSLKRWQLLYRGTDDGFRSSDFHRKCDGHGNTLTVIVTTNNFIFGGFTPVPWDSSGTYKPDSAKKSFLFTLKNSRKIKERKFGMSTTANAIYCNGSYGPTFGDSHSMIVTDQCNANTSSYTNLTGVYINDTGITNTEVFTGQQYFQVKDIEIFAIID
jgi:hypothetical protein